MSPALALALALGSHHAEATPEPAQLIGLNGFTTTPIFTIGESMSGYFPPGIPDGMAAYDRGDEVYLLVNHELVANAGYEYPLDNGTLLRGARVSTFVIDKASRSVVDVGLSYRTIYNRAGDVVDDPSDLVFGGLQRLCSAFGVEAGEAGFVDAIFFTGEETGGGTEFALDVANGELWAAPALGVGAWESVTPLSIPSIERTHVALLLGDDRGAAPLYLYVGEKDNSPGAGFLERNGLAAGTLHMWKAGDGADQPSEFTGTGAFKKGSFVPVENFNPAGSAPDFDDLGYATQGYLDAQRDALGAFRFSRPEDLHTNPFNGRQAIFASTGRQLTLDGAVDDSDLWGTVYLIDVKISPAAIKKGDIRAHLRVSFDGDDAVGNGLASPDFGIRSPDNLCWAGDHRAYIQEDRSVGGFGADSGEETSIWQLRPQNSAIKRVGQIDRSAVPAGQIDTDPLDLGDWESSGIIDVSGMFGEAAGSLLLFNVQAHSVRGGAIDVEDLVQGGQILFMQRD